MLKSYNELKAFSINRSTISNFEKVSKQNVRQSKVRGYYEQAKDSLNDWEEKFLQQQEIKKAQEVAQKFKPLSPSLTKRSKQDDTVVIQTEIKSPVVEKIQIPEHTINMSQQQRPSNRLQRLGHSFAQSLFMNEQLATN